MDIIKIGYFLAKLRKEKGLTQEQLALKIGVNNKTISRWETGNYMPPIEMILKLSEFYNVSINEILSGERLSDLDYKDSAETNLKEVLLASSFTIKEKQDYFKKKWKREHLSEFCAVFISFIILLMITFRVNKYIFICMLMAFFLYVICLNNRMMIYVENMIYGDIK